MESMLNLIEEHGLLGVPMSLLAKKAGVAAGTIYHYFDSKDVLILELFNDIKTKIDHEIFKIKYDSKADYGTKFRQVWINLCQYFMDHPMVLNFMDQFFTSPYHKMLHSDESQFYESNFWSFFANGIKEKTIKIDDIHMINTLFMGSLTIAAKKHTSGHYIMDEKKLALMASIVWDGLKAE